MIDTDTKVTGKLNSDTANESVMNWLPNSRTPSLPETINCKERRMSATICEKISLGAAVLSPYHSLSGGWLQCEALLPLDMLVFNCEVRKVFSGVTLRP